MKRALLVAVVVVAALAVAQQPRIAPPPARDAGTRIVDAGVAAPQPERPELSDRAQTIEIDKLRKEVTELRARVADLDQRQQKADSRADSLAKQVDELNKQLSTLKDQVSDVKEAEDRRQEAEKAVATRKAQVVQANAALVGALQQLSTGATNIEGALRLAEASYSGNALQLVQAARRALGSDVLLARQLLTLAIIEAEAAK